MTLSFGVYPLLTRYSKILEYAVKMLFESNPGMGVFIVLHDNKTYIPIQGHELELACAIVLDNTSDLVCKCSKAEDICNWCTFNGVEAVVVWGVIAVIVGD